MPRISQDTYRRPAPASTELKNPRFASDPALAKVSHGDLTLRTGDQGDSVRRVQQSLFDLGYSLPKHGVDGHLGSETMGAVNKFLTERGLPRRDTIDATVLTELDRAAPPPGQKTKKFPEYDRMFKDGVMYTTVATGYDEGGWGKFTSHQTKAGLEARGFQPLDVKNLTDTQLKEMGLDPAKIDRRSEYYHSNFEHKGKPVQALVRLVDQDSPAARDQFARGFANDELVLYAGHARYGSGPDFDPMGSDRGNFVVGINGKGHRNGSLKRARVEEEHTGGLRKSLKNHPNDLERTKMTDDYQLMAMTGCTTKNYLDELRGIPKNKNANNLDLFLSNDLLNWANCADSSLQVLDNVMRGRSLGHIQAELEQLHKVKFTGSW